MRSACRSLLAYAVGCLSSTATQATAQSPLPAAERPETIKAPPLAPFSFDLPRRISLESGARLVLQPLVGRRWIDGFVRFRAPGGPTLELLSHCILEADDPALDLRAWCLRRGATLEIECVEDGLLFGFRCAPEDASEMIAAIATRATAPTWPDDGLSSAREAVRSAARRDRSDPRWMADEAVRRALHGAPRLDRIEIASSISRPELERFQRTQFGRDRMTVAVAGGVEVQGFVEDLERISARLPAVGAAEPAPVQAFQRPARTQVYILPSDSGHGGALLRIASPGTHELDPDAAALQLWSAWVGEGSRSHRLARALFAAGLPDRNARAAFSRSWRRTGYFEAHLEVPAGRIGNAYDLLAKVLEESLVPPSMEGLAGARERLVEGLDPSDTRPRAVLRRALELDWHGYPPDFASKREQSLKRLDPEQVAGAAARLLRLDQCVVVALGPIEVLRRELAHVGEVQVLHLASDAPDAQPPLAESMLEALGGRDRWARLGGIEADIRIDASVRFLDTTQGHDMQHLRFRVDVGRGSDATRMFLDEERLWRTSSSGPVALSEERAKAESRTTRASLWRVLADLARGAPDVVRVSGGGLLSITGPGSANVTLELGEDHRPRRFESRYPNGTTKSYRIEGWRATAGLSIPEHIIEEGGDASWTITRVVATDSFDEGLMRGR